MISFFSNKAHYFLCMSSINIFGEHIFHCRKQLEFIYRHKMVKDVLYNILLIAKIPVKKETFVNFFTLLNEIRSTHTTANMIIYS